MNKKVEFYQHNLDAIDMEEVQKVLNSLFLTTGKWVEQFESKLAGYLNSKYCIGVTSCTDALFLSLKALGITAGDEVITTPMSFISSSNAIEYCGATPVFVDIEQSTGNINAELISDKVNSKTKAILVTHLYGHMCDMRHIQRIAQEHDLRIIEDCAHCVEGERDSIKPGQLSDTACFSFYATKNITAGEGGAICTNSKNLYEWLLKARLHGMSKGAADRYSKKYEHWDMEFLGYKANMNNIQAALLIHQLDRIDVLLDRRYTIAQKYEVGFSDNSSIRTLKTCNGTKHAKHLYPIMVNPEKRDEIISSLQEKGIGIGVNFRSIHLLSYYRKKYGYCRGDFPVAEKFGDATISLPFYPKLEDPAIDYVIKSVNEITSASASKKEAVQQNEIIQ